MIPITNAQLEIIKDDLKLNEIIKSDDVSNRVRTLSQKQFSRTFPGLFQDSD